VWGRTRHTDIDGRLADAFELHSRVHLAPFSFEDLRRSPIGLFKEGLDAFFDLRAADDNERPGLHESDGPGMVSGVKQFVQHVVGNARGEEVIPDITSLVDGLVEAALFGFRKFTGRRFGVLFHPCTITPVR
jgi:hypothetical protein